MSSLTTARLLQTCVQAAIAHPLFGHAVHAASKKVAADLTKVLPTYPTAPDYASGVCAGRWCSFLLACLQECILLPPTSSAYSLTAALPAPDCRRIFLLHVFCGFSPQVVAVGSMHAARRPLAAGSCCPHLLVCLLSTHKVITLVVDRVVVLHGSAGYAFCFANWNPPVLTEPDVLCPSGYEVTEQSGKPL